MPFELGFSEEARGQLATLRSNPAFEKRAKSVTKAIGLLQSNPRHPGLNSHKYDTMRGPGGAEVFEAYAENNTPGAYRIFWSYGPGKNMIYVIAITPHP